MAKFFKPIGELCTPAKIYMVIAIFSIIASFMTDSILGIIGHAVISLLWAFFLGWLCDHGHSGLSWFLVVWLPALMFIFFIFAFVYLITRKKEERKALEAKLAADDKKKHEHNDQHAHHGQHVASSESFSMFGGQPYAEGMTNAKQPSKKSIQNMANIAQKAINSSK
jgi:Ca2+/Na+ antiporter